MRASRSTGATRCSITRSAINTSGRRPHADGSSAQEEQSARHHGWIAGGGGNRFLSMLIHLIGVCGTGMGSLAGLLAGMGHRVRGSDENVYTPVSTLVRSL